MVAYNFQPGFAEAIVHGIKQSTMRPQGKRAHARPGQMVQLFIGARTKSTVRLLEAPVVQTATVDVDQAGVVMNGVRWTDAARLHSFARGEGFDTICNLQAWFDRRYGLPVTGLTLIQWSFKDAVFRAEWPIADQVAA
jgi:hypothetical protein